MNEYKRQDLENYVKHYAKWPEHRVKRETAIALKRILEEGGYPLPGSTTPTTKHKNAVTPQHAKPRNDNLKTSSKHSLMTQTQNQNGNSAKVSQNTKNNEIKKPVVVVTAATESTKTKKENQIDVPSKTFQKQLKKGTGISEEELKEWEKQSTTTTEQETDNESEWTPIIRCLLCNKRVASMCFQCQCESFGCECVKNKKNSVNTSSPLNIHVTECEEKNINTGTMKLKKERDSLNNNNNKSNHTQNSSVVESSEWTQTVQKEIWSLKEQLHKRQETISKLLAIQEHLKSDSDFDGDDSSLVYSQMEKNQQDIWQTSKTCVHALQCYREFIERRRSKEQTIINDGSVDMDVVEAWQKKHTDRVKTLNDFEKEYDKCLEWMRKLSMPLALPIQEHQ